MSSQEIDSPADIYEFMDRVFPNSLRQQSHSVPFEQVDAGESNISKIFKDQAPQSSQTAAFGQTPTTVPGHESLPAPGAFDYAAGYVSLDLSLVPSSFAFQAQSDGLGSERPQTIPPVQRFGLPSNGTLPSMASAVFPQQQAGYGLHGSFPGLLYPVSARTSSSRVLGPDNQLHDDLNVAQSNPVWSSFSSDTTNSEIDHNVASYSAQTATVISQPELKNDLYRHLGQPSQGFSYERVSEMMQSTSLGYQQFDQLPELPVATPISAELAVAGARYATQPDAALPAVAPTGIIITSIVRIWSWISILKLACARAAFNVVV
ncbi:hypothetical protein OBBRIDRAFT_836432 [Obba rivulosa]|uniref:Uncharacterized protein n=1 Tax=Obba rivulosa TaxID=1052685 RepID=A0A8E2DMX9_9APHY|nr:hypothetical protein OBBRIDRAFT_836432 [Obba rivulosa]